MEYKEIPAISQSMLKDLATSPRLFEAKHILKTLQSESTRSQELGTVIHSAILEPKKLEKVCTTPPRSVLASNGHRRGKAYELNEPYCRVVCPAQIKYRVDGLDSVIRDFSDPTVHLSHSRSSRARGVS